jgi:hypothetical protein
MRVEPVVLLAQHRRIDDRAMRDQRNRVRPDDSARDEVELQQKVIDDDGVACVVPALSADNEMRAIGEEVDELALALVTPLQAEDDGYWTRLVNRFRHRSPRDRLATP